MVDAQPTKTSPSTVVTQELRRSGTAQVYWRNTLSLSGELDTFAPVAGAGGTWFLRGKAGEPKDVIKAELE